MAVACGQVLAQAQRERHLARLEGLQAELRMGVHADDGLRMLFCQRLDLHAAFCGAHEQDALVGAVEDGGEVHLAHDGRRPG